MMNTIEGGVTAAKGFMAASAEAGIKYKNRTDMALVYTESPAVCAGTFTTNVVKAAPVWWDKEIVESKKDVHAVELPTLVPAEKAKKLMNTWLHKLQRHLAFRQKRF